MLYQLNQQLITSVQEKYFFKSDHRTGDAEKSQWIISLLEEVAVFEYAFRADWFSSSRSHLFGLYFVDDIPSPLGQSESRIDPSVKLWLAKFVKSNEPIVWHGYPANYRRRPQDRPETNILMDWYAKGHISKREIAKIRGGMKCSLSE